MEAAITGPTGRIALENTTVTIGRLPDNSLVLQDVRVSGHHATIMLSGQDYVINDVGSTNGTYVNGQRVARETPRILKADDAILLGRTTLVFEVSGGTQDDIDDTLTEQPQNTPNDTPPTPKTVEIYYSYAEKDEELQRELEKHLRTMQRRGLISEWNKSIISGGMDVSKEINAHLNTADIILLLVSSDFIGTYKYYDVEVERAMQRYDLGQALVMLVLLRPVDWKGARFDKLSPLPSNGKPVTTWRNRDEAFLNIARGIHNAVLKLMGLPPSEEFEQLDILQPTPPPSPVPPPSDLPGLASKKPLLDSAATAMKDCRYQEALTLYDKASQQDPRSAPALLGKGDALCRLNRYAEAITMLDRAIQLDDSSARAYVVRGDTFSNLSRYDEALAEYERAIQLDLLFALAYFGKSSVLHWRNRFEEALPVIELSIQLDPNYIPAYGLKAEVLYRLNRHSGVKAVCQEGLIAFDRAIGLELNHAEIYNGRGSLLLFLKRNEEALSAANQAVQIDAGLASAYAIKGAALAGLNRFEEAVAAFEQALQLNPNVAFYYWMKGNVLPNLNRKVEALAACERAIEIEPSFAYAYVSKANMLVMLGRSTEAFTLIDRALLLDPNCASAYYTKSHLYGSLNRVAEALAACERACQLDPTNPMFLCGKADLLMRMMRFGDALAVCQQALVADPNFAPAYNGKGAALVQLNRYAEALIEFEKAIQLAPTFALAYFNEGRVLQFFGRYFEAQQVFAIAMKLGYGQ